MERRDLNEFIATKLEIINAQLHNIERWLYWAGSIMISIGLAMLIKLASL